MTIVLRCRADHGRAANIDIFDRFLKRASLSGHSRLKRVEVDDDHIDGFDSVNLHLLYVSGMVPPAKQSPMDLWMEGFHAAIHHLRKTGLFGHIPHCCSAFSQGLCRTSRR